MVGQTMTVAQAAAQARTGDLFVFRGRSSADRVIRTVTNAPVNHVGMALVLDDLPPLMWHAELGRGLTCVWCNRRHRGVQLQDLELACEQWLVRYDQRGWWRQLDIAGDPNDTDTAMENAALRVVARMDGLAFPTTAGLVSRWVTGRAGARSEIETAYCAEVVGQTYAEMGLLADDRPANWFDPGRFWSGDGLALTGRYRLGAEIGLTLGDRPSTPVRMQP